MLKVEHEHDEILQKLINVLTIFIPKLLVKVVIHKIRSITHKIVEKIVKAKYWTTVYLKTGLLHAWDTEMKYTITANKDSIAIPKSKTPN